MKYTVHMSCGHDETVELFGKSEDRDKKIKRMEECGICFKCRKKLREKQMQEFNKAHDLPDLQGSEKQINWANSIRKSLIEKFEIEKSLVPINRMNKDFARWLDVYSAKYYKNPSASWWIDHIDWTVFRRGLLQSAVELYKEKDNEEAEK